jgi:hypothetical protein
MRESFLARDHSLPRDSRTSQSFLDCAFDSAPNDI